VGGNLALVRDGDVIEIDARAGTMNVKLTQEELDERRSQWRSVVQAPHGGLLEKYARSVGSASVGAVTHSGGVVWPEDLVDGE
jgi:dihydroxy-acid dehydratase